MSEVKRVQESWRRGDAEKRARKQIRKLAQRAKGAIKKAKKRGEWGND